MAGPLAGLRRWPGGSMRLCGSEGSRLGPVPGTPALWRQPAATPLLPACWRSFQGIAPSAQPAAHGLPALPCPSLPSALQRSLGTGPAAWTSLQPTAEAASQGVSAHPPPLMCLAPPLVVTICFAPQLEPPSPLPVHKSCAHDGGRGLAQVSGGFSVMCPLQGP